MTSVENVTYMALSRRFHGSSTTLEPIAFVNVTENGGRAQGLQNFTGYHERISGRISESDPVNSKLEAEFNPGSCADAGEYTCTLVYSDSGSDEDRLAMTRATLNSACDENCLTATLSQSDRYDPTYFGVTCSRPNSYSYNRNCLVSSVLGQEMSVVKTSYPERQQVAFFDRYNSAHSGILHPEYRGRSVFLTRSTSSDLSVEIKDGTCSDAGTYRCKVVYIRSDTHLPDTFIAETTLPSCAPGAVASVTSPQRRPPKFMCKADPSLVSKLLSLEISIVFSGNRTVVAFLHSYLSNGTPEKQIAEGRFRVAGRIDPDSAELSFLSLTAFGGPNVADKVIISCKAVYQSVGDGEVVESFADHSFENLF